MENMGIRIKSRRIALGYSVDELAALLDKNRSTLFRYESGEILNMHLSALVKLSQALGVSLDYLVLGKEAE